MLTASSLQQGDASACIATGTRHTSVMAGARRFDGLIERAERACATARQLTSESAAILWRARIYAEDRRELLKAGETAGPQAESRLRELRAAG